MRITQFAGRLALASILAPAAALAGAAEDTLTGDWNGTRTRLADRGVAFSVNYTAEAARNYRGGERQLNRITGQLGLLTDLDLDKLWGWHDAEFRLAITQRAGRNLSDDARLGTLQQVQEVHGRGQTWRLTQLWYRQAYFNQALSVKFGRVTVGEDFAAFDCTFQNLTFCGSPPGNLVGNYWYNWPVSQWGLVLTAKTGASSYVKLGGYQVNPAYLLHRNALKPNNPAGTTGVLVPLEFGIKPVFNDQIDGSYKFGAWYDSSRHNDVYADIHGGSQALSGLPFGQRRGAYGGYVNFEQQVSAGVRLFFNATQADRRTSTNDRQLAIGGNWGAPFAARPSDDIGFALGTTHVNGRVIRRQRQLNGQLPAPVNVGGYEGVAEVYYTYRATGWLMLRPNLQYIRHPGGSSRNDNATVLGLKFNVDV